MTVMNKLTAVALLLALPALSACGGSDNAPSAATTTAIVGPQTVLFEGKLAVGGSTFYSFTVQTEGNTNVMLASVTTTTSPGSESNVILGLALGTPIGTDCSITTTLQASPALQSPLVAKHTPGVYCARVYDLGNLRSAVNFAVRIVHT